jgi:hypothetical protein
VAVVEVLAEELLVMVEQGFSHTEHLEEEEFSQLVQESTEELVAEVAEAPIAEAAIAQAEPVVLVAYYFIIRRKNDS